MGAMPGLAIYFQRSTDSLGSLTHNAHTQPIWQYVARIKATPVVTDLQRYLSWLAAQIYGGLAGPRMFGDIIERFLGNTVQGDLQIR
jgi:hypothetical protein